MTNYFCPDCGELLMINGHCWVCGFCGAEARGLGSVEVREDDKTQSGGSTDTPRGPTA